MRWRQPRGHVDGTNKLLWHGTSIAVVAAILKAGLRIMLYDTPRVPVYMTRLET